ncbi:MAG: DUF839 domain-containing protein, partial [Bacteroidetes bacterium]|nr:DUF839 domain-containing protein [Bacteroidota bacterium]
MNARHASLLLLFFLAFCAESRAQAPTLLHAEGLTAPIGIEIDDQGRLWVAEQGTARDDSRISVVTPDGQVYPFLEGLPSETNATGEVTGTNHPYFDDDGNLMIVQGEGTDPLSASLLLVDTTGFAPGDAPLSPGDIHTAHDIGGFVLDQGFAETNPYTLVPGP